MYSLMNLRLCQLLLVVLLQGCTASALPFEEITYTSEQGFVVKKDNATPQALPGEALTLNTDGIGTVVIYDTLRCGKEDIALFQVIAEISSSNFSLSAVEGYSVLVLDRASAKTWIIDVSKCCIILRHKKAGTVTLLANPSCDGLQRPRGEGIF
jgi:hypothetical protein